MNIPRSVDDFLRSGFTFTKNELDLKLKFHFFNMLLFLNTAAVFFAGLFRIYRVEYLQSFVDFIYTIISLMMIFLARRDKEKFSHYVHMAMIVALVTVSLTFILNRTEHNFVGISWFYVEVLVVFFLTGRKFTLAIIAISLSIIFSTMFFYEGVQGIIRIAFGLIPFFVFTLFVSLYEKRNTLQLDLLEEQNNILENYSYNLEHFDHLTQLPNRNLFMKNLNYTIEAVKFNGTSFSLININIDDFKSINDSYGRSFGDAILIEVAHRLEKVLYKENNLSRVGPDEFIVLSETISPAELLKIANHIQTKILERISHDDKNIFITCSIGIAIYPKDGTTADVLMRNIESALHDAKKSARNSIRFYNSLLTQQLNEKLIMLSELKHALEKRELEVYYQPQIDASKNIFIGMEALVRWKHPTQGYISPEIFIPLAEEHEIIKDVDFFVMQQAMKDFLIFKKSYPKLGRLSVNLSVKLLVMNHYVYEIQNIMRKVGFHPNDLELEVTEGSIIHDIERSKDLLLKLTALNIKLAIDDFGTGYSSLSYLQKFSFNKLKIDRSFVINMLHDEEGANLVKSIINIAKALNLSLIAEGVEKEEERDFLVAHGCFDIQGYLYSKPLCFEDMLEYLSRQKFNDSITHT